ncbi:MAG: class I SAM-dependent methyltransferase [Alphaproteobacteria bacterium]|nr:class I SAM-dependent methyltransferase [Alphaproteobacteria bacterium]
MTISAFNRIGVAEVPLRKVRAEHLPIIYGDFREVVEARIAQAKGDDYQSKELRRFFSYLLSEIDPDQYRRIQLHYLDPQIVERDSDVVKYLDPILWFESKLRLAWFLNLDKAPPMRILDFGTGPGHFPFVARFYGHDVTGTELPPRIGTFAGSEHLYEALCTLYQVKRIGHWIKPNAPLEGLGGRYDLVTAFLAAFNVDEKLKPWTADHWRVFLKSLKADVLTENGFLFMTLADGKLTPESWSYLASIAEWSFEKSKQIKITKFDALG